MERAGLIVGLRGDAEALPPGAAMPEATMPGGVGGISDRARLEAERRTVGGRAPAAPASDPGTARVLRAA